MFCSYDLAPAIANLLCVNVVVPLRGGEATAKVRAAARGMSKHEKNATPTQAQAAQLYQAQAEILLLLTLSITASGVVECMPYVVYV